MSSEFYSALQFTISQAFVSSFLSATLVLIAVPGFSKLKKSRTFARTLLLFPQMVSTLFVVLGLLISFSIFRGGFPLGYWGVILGHVFINSGLCLLIIGDKAAQIEKQWAGLSQFLGASRFFY